MERSGQVTLQFGVLDHIEPIPDVPLDRLYRERLLQVEHFDAAGFYAYHLAEHHKRSSSGAPNRAGSVGTASEPASVLWPGPRTRSARIWMST